MRARKASISVLTARRAQEGEPGMRLKKKDSYVKREDEADKHAQATSRDARERETGSFFSEVSERDVRDG